MNGKQCRAFDGVFQGRRVLVTGHTGFKGSWLCDLRLLGSLWNAGNAPRKVWA
jgi:CDP-glucose 4,6-dehydratase